MDDIQFLDDSGAFRLNDPETVGGLYFPLASEIGLKSAISPNLGGDTCLILSTIWLLISKRELTSEPISF